MINWKITEQGYDKDNTAHIGNKFFIGNGYMGVRGTLDEADKTQLAAINLAGIYDQVGSSWREPVNAPNGCYGYLIVDDKVIRIPDIIPEKHYITLDYRYGILTRFSEWTTKRGNISLETERFVSMDNVHLGAVRYRVRADFHADVKLVTGIDGDVWDINGPHYSKLIFSDDDNTSISGITHEKGETVSVTFDENVDFPCEKEIVKDKKKLLSCINFITDINKCYIVDKFFCVYTSKDSDDPLSLAQNDVIQAAKTGFDGEAARHKAKWDEIWKYSEIEIEGDDKAMEALNYSCYQLQSIAPRHSTNLSIPARGLSGQTYKGAVFWDTEMFMMDYFLMTSPEVAKSLVKYRIDSLVGAKQKASQYGYAGAFYAWESQEIGYDACSDYNVTDVFSRRPMRTYFRDKQIHISAAVVYGIIRYIDLSGDCSILSEGGAETIIECALFYHDLLLKKVSGGKYELHDVIGPDEYHERINNNGYTNRMAQFTFEQAATVIRQRDRLSKTSAAKLSEQYDLDHLQEIFEIAGKNMYIPQPDENNVIPQFDGYFKLENVLVDDVRKRLLNPKEYWGGAYGVATHTQVIKQADVVTWLAMFNNDFNSEVKSANWNYYEPRTEHGSSLSACMYALLACECGWIDKAYPLFIKSASADLDAGGKEWAGLVYIGGIHPASHGGAYMVAIRGLAGVSFEDNKIIVNPNLPEHWKKMKFTIRYRDVAYRICIADKKAEITVV